MIVVARYTENVDWTKQFPNVTIYNKGQKMEGYNEIFLNNVGREGHTYYKHICDNYYTLDDYTIFLQGNPFDHSPSIISNLHKYLDRIKHEPLDFEFLSEHIVDSTFNLERGKYWQCAHIHTNWERVFGVAVNDHECIFGAGAQFIVSKERIHRHPKSFYENIVKMLEYTVDPLEGYDIERFHKYIFMGDA